MRYTKAIVSLDAIKYNFEVIKHLTKSTTHIMPVIKANAYGHGAVEVGKTLYNLGAKIFAVAIAEEGIELRLNDIDTEILVLGLCLPDDAEKYVKYNLIATICYDEQLQVLEEASKKNNKSLDVMLKIETGMGRIGCLPTDALKLLQKVNTSKYLNLKGIFTHCANADAYDKTSAIKQLALFNKFVQDAYTNDLINDSTLISAANSAVTIDLCQGHFNTIRPGIILYGLEPSNTMHNKLTLKPALRLVTNVIYVKKVPAGTQISYGHTYTCPTSTTLATLPIGYADGYMRQLSNKADVLINGKRCRVVGRVCMDQIIVDVGYDSDVHIGSEAVLIGTQGNEEITATELAIKADTINYEIICAISPRVPRFYEA